MLRFGQQQPTGAAHGLPIVFVGGSAEQTNLIVLAVAVQARPGESMGTISGEESLQKFHRAALGARGY